MKINLLTYIIIFTLFNNVIAQPSVGTWSNTGPIQFPTNVSGQVDGMGRVCQLKFHPTNAAKMYAVSASGGLYISTDTGKNWAVTPGTEIMPGNQCSSVCIDYTNDNIIYLSTGDPDYYYEDYGIWKSINGGITFNPSNTGIGNRMATEIIIDPNNHNNLIAATDDGIWKTTDAGATWSEKVTGGRFRSMKLKPGSNKVLYAATDSSFFKSVDTGNTWVQITSGITIPPSNGGMRIGVTAADTNVVYLGTTDGYGTIMKSVDGGQTFSTIYSSTTQCIVCYDSTITSGSQGDYNFNLTVNPANANELLLVSHCVWRSIDGGLTWSWRTQWWNQVHTDMHDIEFDPYNLNLRFNANDGGVWLSIDSLATNWEPRSNKLSATEIYHAAQSPVLRQMISIGTQDNGELYFDNIWKCNRGGDWGAKCDFDYLNNSTVYYLNTGQRRNLAPLGGDQTFNAPFIPTNDANIEFVPKMHNLVFAGKDTLWRSININTSSPAWQQLFVLTGEKILSIASCRADTNILYFVTDNGHFYRCINALSATPTFTFLLTPAATNVLASVATNKYNANIVYLSCNNAIYRSVNKGSTWANITGSLPGLNIMKVIADDYSTTERLFVCEGNYVFYKDNTTSWTSSVGLPSICQYTDFMIYNDSTSASILRLSTYGRGVWECNIQNNMPPTGDFLANKQYLCVGDTVHYSKSAFGSISSFVWNFPGGTPSSSGIDSPVVVYNTIGNYNATLTLTGSTGTDSIIKTAYISVSHGIGTSLNEGFESSTFPPSPQWVQESISGHQWQHSTSVGGYAVSSSCMWFDNFDNDAGGRHDRILTPKIDLISATSAQLYFDVAYAFYPGYHDSLMIEISTDCGITFSPIYEKDSSLLATAPNTTASFVPDLSMWRTDTISLNSWVGNSIILAFDNVGHYGQNLYIDNINVDFLPLITKNIILNDEVNLYPNPSIGIFNIQSKNINSKYLDILCFNAIGSLVLQKQVSLNNGELNTAINLSNQPKGIYTLKIVSENGSSIIKKVMLW